MGCDDKSRGLRLDALTPAERGSQRGAGGWEQEAPGQSGPLPPPRTGMGRAGRGASAALPCSSGVGSALLAPPLSLARSPLPAAPPFSLCLKVGEETGRGGLRARRGGRGAGCGRARPGRAAPRSCGGGGREGGGGEKSGASLSIFPTRAPEPGGSASVGGGPARPGPLRAGLSAGNMEAGVEEGEGREAEPGGSSTAEARSASLQRVFYE